MKNEKLFKKSNYIDLSLIGNQNNVAVLFSEILTLSLLESIDLNIIKCNIRNSLLLEKSDSNSKLSVINKIDKDENNHLQHYFVIVLDRANIFHVELNCVYRRKNIIYLNIITSKALNHYNWGDKYTRQMQNNYIMDNYAKNVYNLFTKDDINELYTTITIISSNKAILSENKYSFKYIISDTNNTLLSIVSFDSGLLKFSIFQNDIKYYIYFTKNKIGLNYLCLEIERIIYKIKSI